MINYQKFNCFAILTINSVTNGVRELNGTSQISLVTHDAKGEMREIKMRYRQVSRECVVYSRRSSAHPFKKPMRGSRNFCQGGGGGGGGSNCLFPVVTHIT